MPYKEMKDKLDNNRKWRLNNPDKVLQASKERWSDAIQRKKVKISRMKKVYDISQEQAEDLFDTMLCDICNTAISFDTQSDGLPNANIDHDHTTGEVRGVLCAKCNHMLGKAEDNIKILQNAIKYLLFT